MHLNSLLLFKKYAANCFSENIKVLEIGFSGISDYQKTVMKTFKVNWYTLELTNSPNNRPNESNHIQTNDEYNFPINENEFDIILSGQVIEHVKKPWVWLTELKRILKPEGHIITINPVSWHYHEDPVDCWRMYPEAIKALSEECGLKYEFAIWENLEWEYLGLKVKYLKVPNFTIPGKSLADKAGNLFSFNRQKYFLNRILVNFPFFRRFLAGIQISYDTISILRKFTNETN